MKSGRLFFSFAFFFFIFVGLASTGNSEQEGSDSKKEVIQLSGEHKLVKTYYDDGKLKSEWNFKGNKPSGICKIYYKSGEIAYIDTYLDGEKINRKAYDPEGKLKFDENYPSLQLKVETTESVVPEYKAESLSETKGGPEVQEKTSEKGSPKSEIKAPIGNKEFGLMLGGWLGIHNANDAFVIAPYYSAPFSKSNPYLRFLLPLSIGFGLGLPSGTSGYVISLTPGIEYDVNLYNEKFFISPTFAVALSYQNTDLFGLKVHSFVLGFVPALQLKFRASEHVNVRFIPFGIIISPWQYSSQGLGSQTQVVISYLLYGGVGYTF